MEIYMTILRFATNGKMAPRGYHFSRQQMGAGSYELELFGEKGFCSAKNDTLLMQHENSWNSR